jgi:predicted CopG family antitoxin
MGTKTISLKIEAYNRLKAARRYPDESFSEVVLRATWPEDTVTGSDFLEFWRSHASSLTEDEWNRIEELKRLERAPEDKWACRREAVPALHGRRRDGRRPGDARSPAMGRLPGAPLRPQLDARRVLAPPRPWPTTFRC